MPKSLAIWHGLENSGRHFKLKGTLYIVATPIGNLEDITARALRTLREADIIAAEDTRHTLKLLNYFEIKKPMVSYWGEKEKAKAAEVLAKLKNGLNVALVSDAGTPGISDPGAVLVREALAADYDVIPIPGPSGLIAALSVSGLPTEEFTFMGFLPAKMGPRQRKLTDISLEPRTLVFYESPHRLIDTLIDMEKVFGGRQAAVFKELTKMYERVYRGSMSEILDIFEDDETPLMGEYIIAVAGKSKEGPRGLDEAVLEVRSLIKKGMGRKEAVKTIATQYGLKKKELYALSLTDKAPLDPDALAEN